MKQINSPEEFLQQVRRMLHKIEKQEERILQIIENGDLEAFIIEVLDFESRIDIQLDKKEDRRAIIREMLRLLSLKKLIPTATQRENFYYLTLDFIHSLFKHYDMQITEENYLELMAAIQEQRKKDKKRLRFL